MKGAVSGKWTAPSWPTSRWWTGNIASSTPQRCLNSTANRRRMMDEINHVVITDFDKKTWGTSGVKWARSLKNLALPGVALDFGIPPEGKETIAELGLSCVPGRSTYNSRAIDRYDSVIGNGIPPGVWLLCPPDFALTSDTRNLFKLGERKLVCKSHTLQPFFLVFPVVSIENRVKVSALVEEKVIKKY